MHSTGDEGCVTRVAQNDNAITVHAFTNYGSQLLHIMTCHLAHCSEDGIFDTVVISRLLKLKFFNYFRLSGELRFSSLLFYDWLKKF